MSSAPDGWQDNPDLPGPVPDWIIMGVRHGPGFLVTATSVLEKAQHDQHFEGYELGPAVNGLPARQPKWRHILGCMFTRYSVVHGSSFEECMRSLLEVWRPE